MNYQVCFTPDAERDLLFIFQTERERCHVHGQATRFIRSLLEYCEFFRWVPHQGAQQVPGEHAFRIVRFRRRVTLAFRVDDRKKQVIFLRLRHDISGPAPQS